MTEQHYDAIIVGSGAGGAATAFNLVRAGKRALVLERGDRLPRDGSTLDVKQVLKVGQFKNHDFWVDNHNRIFIPDEHYNVGGKTKWYGAALLRFSPDEFEADTAHQCLAWPFGYDELKPYYDQAEELLRINRFDNEPELQTLIDRIAGGHSGWRAEPLPLGLKREVLQDENEANLLAHIEDQPNCALMTNKQVAGLLHAEGAPREITGVACTDGSTYRGSILILAAGAMTSPRLLQDHLERTGLERTLPSAAMVGVNFKFHINSALLALSPFERHDVLRKTAIFFNDAYPHSNVQCLGWMDGDILATQLPAAVPKFVAKATGARAVGFFVTTEDGSSAENRIVSCGGHGGLPLKDYDFGRIRPSIDEHHAVIRAFERRLLHAGLAGVSRYAGLAGTAHALGSMVTGTDPTTSVVDARGKVHNMDNLSDPEYEYIEGQKVGGFRTVLAVPLMRLASTSRNSWPI